MTYKIDNDELRHKYIDLEMSSTDIAHNYGCSYNTILERLRKIGVSVRNAKEFSNLPSRIEKSKMQSKLYWVKKEDLVELYINKNYSLKKIASIYKADRNNVKALIIKYGIPMRTHAEIQKVKSNTLMKPLSIHNATEEELRIKYFKENKSIVTISKEYKCSPTPVIDRFNELGIKFRSNAESGIRFKISKEDLEYKYHKLNMGVIEIANELGCTHRNVSHKLKNNNIRVRNWDNITIEEKNKRISNVMRAINIRPNKPETYLMKLLDFAYPNEWKYVGNGQVVVGGKNPDFINCDGRKMFIELFGDFWHKGENPKDREKLFEKYGYRTLVIWEKELYKSPNKVLKRIIHFVENFQEVIPNAISSNIW